MKFLVLISTFYFFGAVWSFSGITIEHHDLKFDENVMNVEMNIKRKADRTIINAKAELFEDITEPIYVHSSVYERGDNGEYKHLMNVSANACNILSRVQKRPILKAIIRELLKNSNIQLECPYKRGTYYVKELILDDNLLPPFVQPFMPTGNFMSVNRVSRIIDDMDVTLMRVRFIIDLDPSKAGRSGKFF